MRDGRSGEALQNDPKKGSAGMTYASKNTLHNGFYLFQLPVASPLKEERTLAVLQSAIASS